jgi:hypothetical protein
VPRHDLAAGGEVAEPEAEMSAGFKVGGWLGIV